MCYMNSKQNLMFFFKFGQSLPKFLDFVQVFGW